MADRSEVVLLFSAELEILNETGSADRGNFMNQVSKAFRERSECLKSLGRTEGAKKDSKRAETLEAEAAKLNAEKSQVEIYNRWTGPVTVVLDGSAYRLGVGERKLISRPAGPFQYELPMTGQVSSAKSEPGKTFKLEVGSR